MATDYIASLRAIQRNLDNAAENYRNDPNISPRGRMKLMAHAVIDARQSADKLRDQVAADRNSRRTSLERILFGTGKYDKTQPGGVIVWRDSQDGAAKLTGPEEATEKLQLARTAGDVLLERAVVQVALRKGWRDVVDNFRDAAEPHIASFLDELVAIPSGPQTALADAVTFRVKAPTECFGMKDGLLQAYARDDERAMKFAQDRAAADDYDVILAEPTGQFRPPAGIPSRGAD